MAKKDYICIKLAKRMRLNKLSRYCKSDFAALVLLMKSFIYGKE